MPIIFSDFSPWFAGGIVITHFAAKIVGRSLYQFGKFFLVGGFNFLLDAAILNFFLVATKLTAGLPQTGFKGASFVFGIVSSYMLNKHWTFSAGSSENKSKEIYQFVLVSGVGFVLNVGLDYFFRQYGRQFLEYEADYLGAIFRRDGGGHRHVLEFPRLQIHRL